MSEKLEEIKSALKKHLEKFYVIFTSYKDYNFRQKFYHLANFLKTAVIFGFKISLKVVAFLVATVLFIEAFKLIALGQIAMAAAFVIPAVVALRYSWLPFNVVSSALSIVAAPVVYLAKTIFLTVVDHLIVEFGIDQKAKDRPATQFFEVYDDELDSESPNPSLEFRSSIETNSYQVGPFIISSGSVLRYLLPRNFSYDAIQKSFKKLLNSIIYKSGLSTRAKYIADFPENEAKRLKALKNSSEYLEKLLTVVNELQQKHPVNTLEGALDYIMATDNKAFKFPDGKNWLHYLQKIIVPVELQQKYLLAIHGVINSGVSPYNRSLDGMTGFGTESLELLKENDTMLRTLINGEYPDLIGLDHQISEVKKFVDNVKNGDPEDASADRRLLVLAGPPGLGKTETINNVMKKENIKILVYKKAEKGDGIVGGHVNRILELFKEAKQYGSPVCIFIDELDSILHSNEKDPNSQHDRGPINALQEEISKLKGSKCFVVGATNHFEDLKDTIQSRAGSAAGVVYFRHPEPAVIKMMLQDKLKRYVIKDGDKIIENLAENFYGMSPRDLNAFVYAVADNHKDKKSLITIEDFKLAISKLNATVSQDVPGLRVVFKDVESSDKKGDFMSLILDNCVSEQLSGLSEFFDTTYVNQRIGLDNNLNRVLFRGFSAEKFIKTITNNSSCPSLYFDAAKVEDLKTFLPKLYKKINSYQKCLLVIDNVHLLKKADLEKLSNKHGLLFIIGATEKQELKEEKDFPLDVWDKDIKVKADVPNDAERAEIIKAGIINMHSNGSPIPESLPNCSVALARLCHERITKQEIRAVVESSALGVMHEPRVDGKKPILTYLKMKEAILNSKHKNPSVVSENSTRVRNHWAKKY